jgi:hypothetical protein
LTPPEDRDERSDAADLLCTSGDYLRQRVSHPAPAV